jgi:PAS domain S-box-containing protein
VKARKTSNGGAAPDSDAAALRKQLRQTERRLREVERRYEIVMGAINEGAYDWNIAKGRVEFFESVHRALGLPSGTLKTFEDWHARIHPEDFPRFRDTTIAHLKGDAGRFECDYRYRAEDGSWRWARTHGLASRDKQGRAVRMVGATGDITELKERERELAEQKAILETTLENMDQGITLMDGNLRIIAHNRRFLELLDFPAEKFAQDFYLEEAFRFNAERGEYGPGDADEHVRHRVELARRFEPHDFERTRPDGTVIAIRGRPLPGRAGFVSTYTDVTERRRQEEALRNQSTLTRTIVEQIPNAIFVKDREGRFTLVNRSWTQMSGVSAERAVGHTVHDIYPAAIAERFASEDAKLLAKGPTAAPVEAMHQGPRDMSQWRIVRKAVLSGDDGSVRGLVCTSTDISELKRAEAEIAHHAKFTDEVFDSLPLALSMRDGDGKYLFVNRTWEKCFGAAREDVVGTTLHQRLTKEEADTVLARDRAALERGAGAALDLSEFSLRGRHYLQTRTVMVDSQGTTRGVLIASLDVTEKHEAEQALAQERERLRDQIELTRQVIDESPSAMYLKDRQGRYVQVNDAWLTMVGVTRERAIGRNVLELFPEKESERYYAEDMRLLALAEGASEVESLRTGPDGKPQWVIVRKAVMRRTGGEVVGLVGANTDITRLKQYEARLVTEQRRLDLVVSAAKVGIVDWDGVTRANYYSPRLREIRGYAPDADTSGWTNYFAFIHADDRERVWRRWRDFITGKGPEGHRAEYYTPEEYRLLRADGSHVWVQASGVAERDDKGFVTRWIAAVTDITERRAQDEALRESVRLREEVERMSRHDLKTPLTSVIAMARLLREGGRVVPEDAELLATIERAGYRILNMVNLSLDLFRMETGTYQFHPQAVDVAEVARRVAADLEAQAASKNIDVRVRANGVSAATQEVLARGDELLSYSMFANLVKNAIEAAPPGCVVAISLKRENGSVIAEVNNPGEVPEAMRGRFFQKYATTGKSAGLGLGTYSARLMARVQEGDLSLETSEARGTTLVARMKLAGPDLPRAVENRAAASERAAAGDSLPAHKVLVVDDDEFNRLVLRRYLPVPPLRVAFAVNGRAALEAAETEWPDVVLLDLEMPVMDGYQTAYKLREMERAQGRKRALIVAISSNDEERIVARARAAGCDEYLVKPAPREALWRILGASAGHAATESAPSAASASAPVLVDEDLKAMLPEFLRSRRELLDEMPAALAAGDRTHLRRCAHRLAGSFALYGFAWAAAQCRALEHDAQDGGERSLEERVAAVRAHLDCVTIDYAPATGTLGAGKA